MVYKNYILRVILRAYIYIYIVIFRLFIIYICDKWVPVTMAWCVLRLRMEEWQHQNYPLNGSRDTNENFFVQIEKHPYLLTIAA